MSFHYNQKDFVNALVSVGLKKGDIIFSHSNIGYFGLPEGANSVQDIFQIILNSFFDVIGSEGTLIVPTFTYSFPRQEVFDAENSVSSCGNFAEMVRQLPDSYRSEDPCISVAAVGKYAKELTCGVPENAYGDDSFFGRFYKANGVICNMNFDAGSTMVHYVERCLRVPYRFDKTFSGIVKRKDIEISKNSTIYVRDLTIKGTAVNFKPFAELAVNNGLYKISSVGRGFVGAITINNTFNLIKETLKFRPWFLTEAESLKIEPDLRNAKE